MDARISKTHLAGDDGTRDSQEASAKRGRISLDRSGLLGFDQVEAAHVRASQLAKVGSKPGAPSLIGGKIGGKIGAKVGIKPADRVR